MSKIKLLKFLLIISSLFPICIRAEEDFGTKKIGFIGSLSGIAGEYGNEALNGVRLAIEEEASDTQIKLVVEDDASEMKNGLSSFNKMISVDGVKSIVAGTWWANALVRPAETENTPLISVETSFNKDTVIGKTYFIMQGNLHDWIKVYEPLIADRKWNKGAIIHFSSGFGQTLAEEMKNVFSRQGRELVADLEYSDINANEVRALVLKLKAANPDVVYFDGQPASLATTLKRMHEVGLRNLPVLTNSIAEDMCKNALFECSKINELYFNKRKILSSEFVDKYKVKYGKPPYLDADLAYYGTKYLISALSQQNPIDYLKKGNPISDGVSFEFDEKNVARNLLQEIWKVEEGKIKKF